MSLILYSNKDGPYHTLDEIKETEVQTGLIRQSNVRRGKRFLKGPIPLQDIAGAARLPGKALAVFLLIHHQTALTGKPIVILPSKLLGDFGISRSAKARCLSLLENTGLIAVTRSRGKAARIQLNQTKGDNNI
jgi:hypothetical protein